MLSEWHDYLMILEHGKLMYFGLCHKSIQFFGNIQLNVPNYTNPFDYFLDVVNSDFLQSNQNSAFVHSKFDELLLPSIRNEIDRINEKRRKIDYGAKYWKKLTIRPNGFWTQLKVLLKRNFMNHLRNPSMYLIRLIMYVLLCICAGAFDYHIGTSDSDVNDRVTILFCVETFLTLLSISAMPSFVEERFVNCSIEIYFIYILFVCFCMI